MIKRLYKHKLVQTCLFTQQEQSTNITDYEQKWLLKKYANQLKYRG